MKSIEKIKEQLLEYRTKYDRKISIHTMSRLEKDARIVKLMVIDTLGEDEEIFTRMDAVIALSQDYHKRHLGLEYAIIYEAFEHFDTGVDLLIEKI